MAEELEKQESQETTEETQETTNNTPTDDELEAIKAQLEEERQAKAAVDAALAEKDTRIGELEAVIAEDAQTLEGLNAQVAQVQEANQAAVSKYLEAVRAANPAIPQGVIIGESIEDIDASLATATTIAESVRTNLENEASNSRVPAGAPARTGIDIEGLSPSEKIAAGVKQQQNQ